jgi:membrane-associated protease RseP (regulator of RpoE activity)
MQKESDITQYSVLAAGSFSNILLAVAALLLLSVVFIPLQQQMVEPTGFTFHQYYGEGYPIEKSGLQPGTIITGINGQETKQFQEFSEIIQCMKPGEQVTLSTDKGNYSIVLTHDPTDEGRGFLGLQTIENTIEVKQNYKAGAGKILYRILSWLVGFLRWLFLLSLGIGLFNLLPLPIVDGGRMMQVTLHRISGTKRGEKQYRIVTLLILAILLLNLFYPLLTKLMEIIF